MPVYMFYRRLTQGGGQFSAWVCGIFFFPGVAEEDRVRLSGSYYVWVVSFICATVGN